MGEEVRLKAGWGGLHKSKLVEQHSKGWISGNGSMCSCGGICPRSSLTHVIISGGR